MEPSYDLVVLSHLRWDLVFQRPQHLLTRFSRTHRVLFIEEPLTAEDGVARCDVGSREGAVTVVTPHLPAGLDAEAAVAAQRALIDGALAQHRVDRYVLWYYTPMALPFTRHLRPLAVVYDCMDELSKFAGAPQGIATLERELLDRADVVFTGGRSLYEAKRHQHPRVYAFPSSIDAAHFALANGPIEEPRDQALLARPRIGFFGVIDERLDVELLAAVADARTAWQIVLLGPVVKIDPATLPRRSNIHHLGSKAYRDLPSYLAGWDVAIMPFALNDATRFISPTKTLEYLAAGKPVVSTPIADVVRPYGENGIVRIARSADGFVAAIEDALQEDASARSADVRRVLAATSWDRTWSDMRDIVTGLVAQRPSARTSSASDALSVASAAAR